ncbi:MAG: sigma-70 family RNA polymerase sigma factor [Pirellulales bacterium]
MEMNQDEKRLWRRLAMVKRPSNRDRIRNQLVEMYQWLANDVANYYSRRLPRFVSREDLLSEANIGLMEGVLRFSLDRNCSPATFLRFRMTGRVIDWLRNIDEISRLHRMQLNKLSKAEEQLGRSISDEECKEELGFHRPPIAPATISIYKSTSQSNDAFGRVKSIAEQIPESRPDRGSLQDCGYLLKGLSPKHRLIVLLYHVQGVPMKQVGIEVGMSESRISQLMPELLSRVRQNAERFESQPVRRAA